MNLSALAVALLAACYLGFGFSKGRAAFRRLRGGSVAAGACLLLIYLLAVNLRPTGEALVRLVVVLTLPALFLHQSRGSKRVTAWHFLAVGALWFPLEPSLFLLPLGDAAHTLAPALRWLTLPPIQTSLSPTLQVPLEKLILVVWALFLFTVRYPLEGIGFTWHLTWADCRRALQGLALFSLGGVPLGLALKFLHWAPHFDTLTKVGLSWLGMYFFVALPEEILFRGLIQNLLRKVPGTRSAASLLAALIFGASHLNNATPGFPVPNWAYMAVATIAGLAYGWVWERQHKVTASALTHASVNILWRILFR